MDRNYLQLLPGDLQQLVVEAESIGRCTIAVKQDANASEFDNLTLAVTAEGIGQATISYRGASVTRWALIHEMLHIKRYWIENVPRLFPVNQRFQFEAVAIDDLIEHLVIIPRERVYVEAESDAHWKAVMATKISTVPVLNARPSEAEVVALQRSLIQHRAMLDIALPHLDNAELYGRLQSAKLLEPSEVFIGNLRRVVDDKVAALGFVGQAFRYDPKGFRVQRYNLQSRIPASPNSAQID